MGPGRLPSPHTGEYTVYAREAAKTFSLGSHAHTNLSGPVREDYVAIHPIGTPFPCGICGLRPGPPSEGPCGTCPYVGRFPMWHEARLAFGPLKKCRCCQHPVATAFLGAACPDPSDTHPSCRGFEIAQVGHLPFIDRMLRKSGTESSSVVTGATDTEKAAEQTNEPPATHAEKQRGERERERTGRERRRGEAQKRGPQAENNRRTKRIG